LWPSPQRPAWMVPLGRATVVTALLFAVGHFVGEYNPARLGPFFPALLFSWLTRRSGSIFGSVVYHGLSNAFSAMLFAGYRR
jgi:membrane protease YdiL (CAAX protease family)